MRHCGCAKDLTCAIVHRDSITGETKHRCVEIPREAKEHKGKNNATQTFNRGMSQKAMAELLKLLNERPRLQK